MIDKTQAKPITQFEKVQAKALKAGFILSRLHLGGNNYQYLFSIQGKQVEWCSNLKQANAFLKSAKAEHAIGEVQQ